MSIEIWLAGGLLTFLGVVLTLVFNQRKTRAEAAKLEAEARRTAVDTDVSVHTHMRQLQSENIELHDTLQAIRNETDKKISEAVSTAVAAVEQRANEKVADLQRQLDDANQRNRDLETVITKQTIDQAKIEIADRYIAERDGLLQRLEAQDLRIAEQDRKIESLERQLAEAREENRKDHDWLERLADGEPPNG